MKRIVLLLVLLLISSNAYTEARVIRTYRPIPYNRGFNPFVRPSSSYFGVGRYNFNNGYYGNYYNRYSNYNNNWRNSRYYYPTRYYNNNYPRPTYNNYYRPQNVNAFDKFHNLNRSIHRYNSSPTRVYRLNRSDIASNIKPVSYTTDANQKDPRLSLVEKNIYGKSFDHQEINLRLNRLEKSMFNKTYPSLSNEEIIKSFKMQFHKNCLNLKKMFLKRLTKKKMT